jgi:ABC-type sugar transport system permease subunit
MDRVGMTARPWDGKSRLAFWYRPAIWFVMPAAAPLVLVLAGPMAYSFKASLTAWSLLSPGSSEVYVGFRNYMEVLADPEYHVVVRTTVAYALSVVAIGLTLGTGLALLLNGDFLLRSVLRSLFIVPMVITPAAVGLFWILLYDEGQGVYNWLLTSLGLPRIAWLGLDYAFLSIVILDVWQSTPFFVLVLLAGLQSMNEELIEAARVDGANALQIFVHLTLPHLLPYMLIASSFRIIAAMGDFDKIYLLTAGGPGLATTTLTIYTYKTGFNAFEIGRTAAMAWLFVGIVLIVSAPLIHYLGRAGPRRAFLTLGHG